MYHKTKRTKIQTPDLFTTKILQLSQVFFIPGVTSWTKAFSYLTILLWLSFSFCPQLKVVVLPRSTTFYVGTSFLLEFMGNPSRLPPLHLLRQTLWSKAKGKANTEDNNTQTDTDVYWQKAASLPFTNSPHTLSHPFPPLTSSLVHFQAFSCLVVYSGLYIL